VNSYSEASLAALKILREPGHVQWSLVPIFALIVYAYAVEIQKKNWNGVVTGLSFLSLDWIAEIINALVLKFSGYAALWSEPSGTSYLILVGINIETALMFLVFGLAVDKLLPAKGHRAAYCVGFAVFAALVETALNAMGALAWDYRFWGWPHLWTVILFAYVPGVAFTIWIRDLKSLRLKARIVAGLYALDAVLLFVFIRVLHWI
jgi:hypothetical protein